ncbi:MAG: hypothetical protein ACYTFT_11405 [Planctomycetota bacterium]
MIDRSEFTLTTANGQRVTSPDEETIRSVVTTLGKVTNDWILLERADRSYVLVTGARLRCLVAYGPVSDDWEPFLLGRAGGDERPESPTVLGKLVKAHRYEMLDEDDAERIFVAFLAAGAPPASYVQRLVPSPVLRREALQANSIERITAYLGRNRPACLEPFHAYHSSIPAALPDRLRSGNPLELTWTVSCKCGHGDGYLHGHDFQLEDGSHLLLDPVHWQCGKCESKQLLFDMSRHGYDAVACGWVDDRDDKGPEVRFACPTCGPTPFRVYLWLWYPEDLPAGEEFAGKWHDLFNSAAIYGVCSTCSAAVDVSDFECA